ncbi:MAG TPA: transcriptional regulator [Candidatus Magasanikbacteria bacterium]|nr:MAG: hypothetical protein A2479_01800 [Candidatus Magasanikbacteria bacterium RIFOXYC2_FULL_39_8]HAT03468.1 transcriptional regulator [Candidatus Magasanikbacteria bacterium]
MNKHVVLLEIQDLKTHEKTSTKRVKEVVELIRKKGEFVKPIVVEKDTHVILDGHHRVKALKKLGYTKVPCMLIDYMSDEVKVYLRRKDLPMKLLKQFILTTALSGDSFNRKTTRHYVAGRKERIRIELSKLE